MGKDYGKKQNLGRFGGCVIMEYIQEQYRIPDENWAMFMSKLDKLNRIAAKLKCNPIVSNIVKQDNEKQDDGSIIIYRTVAILGDAPILNDWTFAAVIQHLKDDADGRINVIRTIPGMGIDITKYQTASSRCAYCMVDRYRKDTYIVQSLITGEQLQVGKTCLKNFTGHVSPYALAAWAEELAIFDEWSSKGQTMGMVGSRYYPLQEYLEWVVMTVRENGWMSSTHAREYGDISTAHAAWNAKFAINLPLRPKSYPTMEDVARAKLVYEYIHQRCLAPDFIPINDYMANIRSIVKADVVDSKLIGLAASIIIVYTNHEKREIEKAHRIDTSKSRYIGLPGEKHTFDALVVGIVPMDSAYGVSELIKLVDDEGNVLTWMKSPGSKFIAELETGRRVVAYGTIKKHNEYKGIAQTVLTRCKILEVYDESPACASKQR